jgi:hypothetical protein
MSVQAAQSATLEPKEVLSHKCSTYKMCNKIAVASKVIVKVALSALAVIVSYGSIIAAGVCIMIYTGNWKALDEVKTLIISAASATALKVLDSISTPIQMFSTVYNYLGTFEGLKTNFVGSDDTKNAIKSQASDLKSKSPVEKISEPSKLDDEEENQNAKKTLKDRLNSSSITVTLTFEQLSELLKKCDASNTTSPKDSNPATLPASEASVSREQSLAQPSDGRVDCA